MKTNEERPQPAGQDADVEFMEGTSQVRSSKSNFVAPTASAIHVGRNLMLSAPVSRFERWYSSFTALIEDDEGARVFYEYLESEQSTMIYDLWLRCQDYKACPPNKAAAKEISSNFVRVKDARLPLSDQARNNLFLRLRNNDIREDLLDEVEGEVFQNLRDVCYTRFLKSDFFKSYKDSTDLLCQQHTNPHLLPPRGLPVVPEGEQASFPYQIGKYSETGIEHGNRRRVQADVDNSSLPGSDAVSGSDHASMPEESGRGHRQPKNNHDGLPNPLNFKPRTQRMNREKPLSPPDFARILTEKLNKLLEERQSTGSDMLHKGLPIAETAPSVASYPQLPSMAGASESSVCSADAHYALPSDRFSVAGQSSHSGYSQGENLVYRHTAKQLVFSIKKQLKMRECNCSACSDGSRSVSSAHHSSGFYAGNCPHSSDNVCQRCLHANSADHQAAVPYSHLSHANIMDHQAGDPDLVPVDNSKIYQWMAKNEKYSQQKLSDPAPSPAIRRKNRQPVMYNSSRGTPLQSTQPIATDPGMPPLPPPNTSTVLEEAKRRLQAGGGTAETSQASTLRRVPKSSTSSAAASMFTQDHSAMIPATSHGYPCPKDQALPPGTFLHPVTGQLMLADYDGHSSIGEGSLWSDSRSSVSAAIPQSEISSVPSSASRMWRMDARSESHSEMWMDYRDAQSEPRSDARSHSTGRSRSTGRSGHRNDNRSTAYSDSRVYHQSDQRHMPCGDMDRGHHHPSASDIIRQDPRNEARSQSSTGRSGGSGSSRSQLKNCTTVTYYFCGDPIPFRISVPIREVTLGQFKEQTKKGNFSYFFKTVSEDDGEVVFLEIKHDDELLPRYGDQIVGKVIKNE